MIYQNFQDLKISALGMGSMRLPVIDGNASQIDEPAAAEMVAYAMEQGINYYDTAWGYHGGTSEIVMGKILAQYPRDQFYLADKFPGYDLSTLPRAKEIFAQQLDKCGVEFFDFYMFHNVCEMNIDAYLDPQYGIFDYLMKEKSRGRIRHLGFSAHGNLDVMKRFLDAYGSHMEFCQIELNWLDWTFQQANAKVELLRQWGIPIWVMEPLRGGSLANLAKEHAVKLNHLRPAESIPAWAFRFLQSIEGVTVTLSGMSNLQQTQENIHTYATHAPLTPAEMNTLLTIGKEMTEGKTLPCTSCRYCTSYCPQELDIPRLLELYNEHKYSGGTYSGGGSIAPMALSALPDSKKPSACIGCRSCENVCPQQIKISDAMKDFVAILKK